MDGVNEAVAAQLGIVEGNHGLMLPPPSLPPTSGRAVNPRPKALVLDEDEWALQLEGIIERDFFPDIPKLQSKLEWLQALRTRDPAALRQAQANIAQRRAGIRTPIGATPGSFETPAASMLRAPHRGAVPTPSMTPLMGPYGDRIQDGAHQQATDDRGETGHPSEAQPPMTLDRFLSKHTSEDNASFADLLADMNARRWAKAPWLLMDATQKADEGDGAEEAADEQGHLRALPWSFQPRNRMFFDGSQQTALQLSSTEHAQRIAGPSKVITHRNTRFVGPSAASHGDSGASTPGEDGDGSMNLAAPGQAVAGAGWGVLATPSMTPGADGDSPFMTWGDIAGTPVRLDATETPEGIGGDREDGPWFSVKETPRRESITRRMAARASTSLKRKAAGLTGTPLARQAAMAAATATATGDGTQGSGTPGWAARTPRHGGSPAAKANARTPTSQAGRLLASSLRAAARGSAAATPDADKQLRATYGHTPSRAGKSTPMRGEVVPAISTMEAARLSKLRQAALNAKQRRAEGKPDAKLTDDLLDV